MTLTIRPFCPIPSTSAGEKHHLALLVRQNRSAMMDCDFMKGNNWDGINKVHHNEKLGSHCRRPPSSLDGPMLYVVVVLLHTKKTCKYADENETQSKTVRDAYCFFSSIFEKILFAWVGFQLLSWELVGSMKRSQMKVGNTPCHRFPSEMYHGRNWIALSTCIAWTI